MQLIFVKSESTFTYFEATRGYLEKHGKPLALYSDKANVFRVNHKNVIGGDGYTQFGRAMYELNIQTICANISSAKGRVERAHLTLQDRLVKELRLRGISSMEEANEYADEFMADYNKRFAKAPRHDFDVHRPLETDDDLAAFFTWREPCRVSKSPTVQYDKVLYMIEDNELSRRAIGKYIEVWHYPDGQKELRLKGRCSPTLLMIAFRKSTKALLSTTRDSGAHSNLLILCRINATITVHRHSLPVMALHGGAENQLRRNLSARSTVTICWKP